MLDFQDQITADYQTVLAELAATPYTAIDYPSNAFPHNWDTLVSDDILPKMTGNLYFIYDSNHTLLYIGKSLDVNTALRSHLVRKMSKSTSSVLDDIKQIVCYGKKRVFIKVLDIQPKQYSGCFKPMLARQLCPKWNKRIS